MTQIRLYLFGAPRLEVGGAPIRLGRRKAMALLAYLALEQLLLRREKICAMLWPELDTTRGRTALRQSLYALRSALDDRCLQAEAETVTWVGDTNFWCDVHEFRRLIQECPPAAPVEDGRSPGCGEQWAAAIRLAHADFMRGFTLADSPDFDEWQFFEAESFRNQRIALLDSLIGALQGNEQVERSIFYAQERLRLEPAHEPTHRTLMQLYVQNGQREAALRQFKRCKDTLEREFATLPEPETIRVAEQIQAVAAPHGHHARSPNGLSLSGRSHLGDIPASDAVPPPNNLPVEGSVFIGRRKVLSDLAKQLRSPECRLLTIIGPGGVGKTRLSLEVAREMLPLFTDGVYFVPLAHLQRAELLAPAIAEPLGLVLSSDLSPVASLLNYLRQRHILLILDNLEHLTAGVGLIQRILDETSQTRLLITSRQRLRLQSEQLIPLDGLEHPQLDEIEVNRLDPNQFEALQFFVQCARRIQPGFKLTAENTPDAARICALINGIPLAIELATPWLRIMSCDAIARGIQESVELLSTTAMGPPNRHRSMTASFNHSWQLLSEAEQRTLAQLSVFRGGFTPDAARQVAGASPTLLLMLADKSWLRVREGRMEMHELALQYCADKFENTLDAERIKQRHGHYFAAFMRDQEKDLYGGGQLDAVARILADIDNVRTSWTWAVTHREVETIDQFVEALAWIGHIRGWYQITADMLEEASWMIERLVAETGGALAQGNSQRRYFVLARTVSRAALHLCRLGVAERASHLCERALVYLTQMASDPSVAREWGYALIARAMIMSGRIPHGEMAEICQQALRKLQAADDSYGMAWARSLEGWALYLSGGDFALAEIYHLDALNELRRTNELDLRSDVLGRLGFMMRIRGEYVRAEMYILERLDLSQRLDSPGMTGLCKMDLGWLAAFATRFEQSIAYFQEGMHIGIRIGHQKLQAYCLEGLGWVAYRQQNWPVAITHCKDALSLFKEIGHGSEASRVHGYLGNIALAVNRSDDARGHYAAGIRSAGDEVSSCLIVLAGIAGLLTITGDSQTAVKLLAFLQHHPDTPKHILDQEVTPLLEQLYDSDAISSLAVAVRLGERMSVGDAVRLVEPVLESQT